MSILARPLISISLGIVCGFFITISSNSELCATVESS